MANIYSHSRLSAFEQCPLKFRFRYIDHLKPEIEQTIEDIRNVSKIIKEKQKKEIKKVFIYVIPKEADLYKESKEFMAKSLGVEINIFMNNDKNKHDPMSKANKSKPGRPSIYLE